jgi:hypothetical protein
VSRTPLGSFSNTGSSTLSATSLSVSTGIVIAVVTVTRNDGGSITITGVTFDGNAMTDDDSRLLASNFDSVTGYVAIYSMPVTTASGKTMTLTASTGTNATLTLEIINVTGLVNNFRDSGGNASMTNNSPDVVMSGVTAADCEYAQAGFLLIGVMGAWTWASPFTSGGQDVSPSILVSATEGYDVAASAGSTPDATLSTGPLVAWAAVMSVYG